MHAEIKRVFVGNLPPDTTQADIRKRFSKFGNVLSVEIKHRPDSSAFAFLDFKTDEDNLKSCFETLSMEKWNGNRIKLELAKESFLSRLEKERQENYKTRPQCSSNDPYVIDANVKSKKRSIKNMEFGKKKHKTEENLSEVNDCSLDESHRLSDNSSDCETLYNGKLKMFGGTRTVIYDSDSDRSHSQSGPNSKISQSASAATNLLQRLELFSDVWKDPSVNCDTTKHDKVIIRNDYFTKKSPSDEAKRLLAEEKRKKSVDEKRKSYQKQKETIKLALSSIDSGHTNNRIIFDSEDYENNAEDAVKQTMSHNISSLSSDDELLGESKRKTVLFEDSSDGEEEGNFKIKSQFEGSKGQKLLELQSRFASDKRFVLDERFYESDEEVPVETSGNAETSGVEDERKVQFQILQDVLGHQISIEDNKKDRSKRISMLRYDPTKPDHAKFEKKTEPKIKKEDFDMSPSKVPKVGYGKREEKVENVIVSKEKFYKVTESLKKTLQKRDERNEFSLRKMFGTSDAGSADEDGEAFCATALNKHKLKEWPKNPFKYDSSDSEEENETHNRNRTDNPQQNIKANVIHSGESLFFKHNDPRLHEGLEFFSTSQVKDESYDFAKHRRELKQIVRSKVKNNLRNHHPRKKKLGGQKAKKFKKAQ